jgi:hypothetical protein
MKQIPFVGFARAEQDALVAMLRQLGVRLGDVCASRFEWDGAALPAATQAITTVTAPGFCATYEADGGLDWIVSLRGDLSRGAGDGPSL